MANEEGICHDPTLQVVREPTLTPKQENPHILVEKKMREIKDDGKQS